MNRRSKQDWIREADRITTNAEDVARRFAAASDNLERLRTVEEEARSQLALAILDVDSAKHNLEWAQNHTLPEAKQVSADVWEKSEDERERAEAHQRIQAAKERVGDLENTLSAAATKRDRVQEALKDSEAKIQAARKKVNSIGATVDAANAELEQWISTLEFGIGRQSPSFFVLDRGSPNSRFMEIQDLMAEIGEDHHQFLGKLHRHLELTRAALINEIQNINQRRKLERGNTGKPPWFPKIPAASSVNASEEPLAPVPGVDTGIHVPFQTFMNSRFEPPPHPNSGTFNRTPLDSRFGEVSEPTRPTGPLTNPFDG